MNKTAIVTGTTSGFGLLTTLELAKNGFQVIATMRNLDKREVFSEYTKDLSILNRIEPFLLDVTSSEQINAFQTKVEKLGQIDVLINNAGMALGGFCEEISLDEYRRQFETNLFGLMSVTKAVLPTFRKQKFGTIINVSSISGRIGFPGLSPYTASKFGLEGYTESLRLEVKPFGIQVALVEPGSYQTNIWSTSMKEFKSTKPTDTTYQNYAEAILSSIESGKENYGDPLEVARLIHRLAIQKKLKKLRYPIGKGVKTAMLIKRILPWHWWERIVIRSINK
jgi:NAD(P)-dependent dehydrogenase (short-subunit alcohol dehydrogenase family)